MASSRQRLQATMDALARKRQKEFEKLEKWSDQIAYYKNWEQHNNIYQNWTSPQLYNNGMMQYAALKNEERKRQSLEERRAKLNQLFFEEQQEYDMEMQISPRNQPKINRKRDETPTEVLKDINIGIKIAEEDRKRHEAELKLYQQWKNENPIIRNYERNQNESDLKLAWLDQQIEKRMQKEKNENEMRKLIEERDKKIKEEEELDLLELEEKKQKEKEFMSEIEKQIKYFKLKEEEADKLKQEEYRTNMKKNEIEDIIRKNQEELRQRKNKECALYNINQSKIKLRKRAQDIEEQLKKEREMIEEILTLKTAEEIENEEKKAVTKQNVLSFLQYVKDQQKLEEQRKKYISFIFDSEAKNIWEKQERQWRVEQEARDKLLKEVLIELKHQIDNKLMKNVEKQKELLKEREEMLKQIEEQDKRMKMCMEELHQKKLERKMELEKQINEKRTLEFEKKKEEEKREMKDFERIKKEEENLKHELMKIQTRQYPQRRYNRRIIW